jgi:hypothetical protein
MLFIPSPVDLIGGISSADERDDPYAPVAGVLTDRGSP